MKNLCNNITYLRTIQDISKQVRKIFTSWHPDNSYLSTGHSFTNGMVSDRQMLLLESRFRHGDTLVHQLIVYIHVSRSFDSHSEHPKCVGQGFDLFTYNATTDDFRYELERLYGVMALAVQADESTVNVNEYSRDRAPSQLVIRIIRVICVNKTCHLDRRDQWMWHVRWQLILGIWVILLPSISFVEIFTVVWHTCIKNKFWFIIVICVGENV